MKPEPKPPRRVWIVRRFGTELWSSRIFCSEQAAVRYILAHRTDGDDGYGYVIGPYKLDVAPAPQCTTCGKGFSSIAHEKCVAKRKKERTK